MLEWKRGFQKQKLELLLLVFERETAVEEKLCIVGMLDIVSLLAELVARLRSNTQL